MAGKLACGVLCLLNRQSTKEYESYDQRGSAIQPYCHVLMSVWRVYGRKKEEEADRRHNSKKRMHYHFTRGLSDLGLVRVVRSLTAG